MSYVNKKIRVFKEAGDVELNRKRSDGRMKTYTSATDARAWCRSTEDRRQHILDLVKQGDGKGLSLGKYIPIEAIIDILLANKNEDIKRLLKEIENLKKFIKDNGLHYEEKPTDGTEKPTAITEYGSVAEPEISKTERPPLEETTSEVSTESTKGGPGHPGDSPDFLNETSDYDSVDEEQKALEGSLSPEEAQVLRDALAEAEELARAQAEITEEAIQMLESIKDIVEGGDGKKRTPLPVMPQRESKVSAPSKRSGASASAGRGTTENIGSCKDEIEALEREIQSMKSTSPEAEIIQREVQVLKKYCDKLAAIQKENADLKKERDMLKGSVASAADDLISDKMSQLDEITQERDRLRARVKELEEELAAYENLPSDIERFSEKASILDSFRLDELNWRERLDEMQGLEDDVKRLRDRALSAHPAGDGTDVEKLKQRIAELERELNKCNCNMKELEILRVERNCLKMRVDDLAKVQQDYEDLLKKTQGFDALKAECATMKAKYEELKNLEDECNELRAKAQRVEELESERQLLMKEIEDCECCMNNQESEIKRLACHIDCLTQDLDKRQDQMKVKVLTMRAHIEKKDCIIAKSEQQLADVQDELRNSIEQLSCEKICLRSRIEELEDEKICLRSRLEELEGEVAGLRSRIQEIEDGVTEHLKMIAAKDDIIKSMEEIIKTLEANAQELQNSKSTLEGENRSLLEKLDAEKSATGKLQEALRKAIKSDEHLKQMLKQAKCAIKCITQKLEKHDFVGIGRLEAERENYLKKIKELEEGMSDQPCGAERIAALEEELMRANAANKCLRDNLEQAKNAMEENEVLRKLASELQNAAKTQVSKIEDTKEDLSKRSHEIGEKCDEIRAMLEEKQKQLQEKEQTIEDLNNQLNQVGHMLESEKKRADELQDIIDKMATNGGVDIEANNRMRGQINVLNAEIDRLNFDLENQKRECEENIKKLKERMEKGETDDERIKRLERENEDLETDVARLKKENELLREEINKMKDKRDKSDSELEKVKGELASLSDIEKDNEALKNEVNKLKGEINKLQGDLAACGDAEKENKRLREEIDELNNNVDRFKKEGEILRDELEKMKGRKDQGFSEVDKLRDELIAKDKVEEENKNLKDEISKLQEQLAAKNAENKNLTQEINNLKDELNNQKHEITSLSDVEKENKDIRDELNKMKRELAAKNELENENKNLKDENNKLKQEAAAKEGLEKENKDLKDEINKLKQELAAKQQEGESKTSQDEVNKLRQEAAEKKAIENENKSLKDEINKLKQDAAAKEALENEVKNLKDQLDKLKQGTNVNEVLENENKKLQDEINKLRQEVAAKEALEKDNKNLNDQLNQLKQGGNVNEVLEKENKDLKDEVNKLRRDAAAKDAVEKENKDLKDEVNKLKQAAAAKDAVEKENKDLKDEVNKLKQAAAAKDAVEKENKDLKDEVNKLKQAAAAKDAVEKENKDLKDEVNRLKQENQNLNDQLNKLKQGTDVNQVLEDENKNLKNEMNKLREQLAAKGAAEDKDDKRDEEFGKERDNLLNQIAAQKKEIADLLNKINEPGKSEDTTTFKELDNKTKENEKLRNTIDDLEKQIKDLRNAQLDMAKGAPDVEKIIGDIQGRLDKEEARARELDKNNEELKKQNDELGEKLNKLQASNADLENKLKKCQESNGELQKKLEQLEQEHADAAKDTEEIMKIGATGDVNEKVKALQNELAKRKKECNDMIAKLKEQFDRDVKNLQKQNAAAIDKLQKAHKDEIDKINKEHDAEVAKLKEQLKTSEAKKEPIAGEPSAKLPSIKEEGEEKPKLSMKTFQDVCICDRLPMVIPIAAPAKELQRSKIRPCTCDQTAGHEQVLPTSHGGKPPSTPHSVMPYVSTPKDVNVSSIKKLMELENKLLVKQTHTKQKITTLQDTVDKFKRELELERQKNNDLLSRYANQSKTVANMKVEMDIVKRENFQERRRVQHLNMTLQNILGDAPSSICRYAGKAFRSSPIPHFHTELTVVKQDDNKYKHSCVMKRKSCACSLNEYSSDSFEIGSRGSSERSLENIENVTTLGAEPLDSKELVNISKRVRGGSDAQDSSNAAKRENALIKTKLQQLEEGTKAYEAYIVWQEKEIKRLSFHLNSVSTDLDKRKQQQKVRRLSTKAFDLDNTVSLQNRINELETQIVEKEIGHQALLERLNEEISEKEKLKQATKVIAKNFLTLAKNGLQPDDGGEDIRRDLENQIIEKDQTIKQLEHEKQILMKQLEGCEEYISNQVDEMKKLAYYIDCLTKESNKGQKETETEENKNAKKEYKNIIKLKSKVSKYKAKLAAKEESIRLLKEDIENERQSKNKLEEALSKVSRIYDDLVKDAYNTERVKRECKMCKRQIEDCKKKINKMEEEKRDQMETIQEYRRLMENQADKINSLICDMNEMAQEHVKRMENMTNTISGMEDHIAHCEQMLSDSRTEQQQYSEEKTCMCEQIKELERQIEDYESDLAQKEENNRILLDNLESERRERIKLHATLEEVTNSHQNVREMLAQARQTIYAITKQLEEYDMERLETQKDNQIKISELQDQLEMASATMKKLRENIDQMKGVMDQNIALRARSAQLHQTANNQLSQLQGANEDLSRSNEKLKDMCNHLKQALYEKDKTFDDLRNQLLGLRQQLDNEQRLREDTETALADVQAARDSEADRLRNIINLLNTEKDKLYAEVENLMKTSEVGQLKTRIKKLEDDNNDLLKEVDRLASYLEAILPGYVDPVELAQLKAQLKKLGVLVKDQKKVIEDEKKRRFETMLQLQEREKEDAKKIKELMQENVELRLRKKGRPPNRPTLVLLEKEKVGDGVQYRYVGGAEGERKEPVQVQPYQPSLSAKIDSEDVNDLRAQLAAASEEIARLREKLKENADVIKKLTAKVAEEEKKVKQLTAQLAEKDQLIKQLTLAKKDDVTRQLKAAIADKDELIGMLNAKLTEAGEAQRQLNDKSMQKSDTIQQLRKALAEKDDEINDLKKNLDVARISALEQENKTLREEVETLQLLLNKPVRKSVSFTSDLEIAEHLKKAIEENESLKKMVKNMQKEIEKSTPWMIEIPKSSAQTPSGSENEQIVKLQKSIEVLKRENRQLKEDLEFLREQKNMPHVSEMYINTMKDLEENIHNWQDEVSEAIQDLTKKIQLPHDSDTDITQIERLLEDLMQSITNNTKHKKAILAREIQENHINELENQLKQSLKENRDLKEELSGLVKKMDKMKKLDVKDQSCEEKVEALQKTLRECELANTRLKEEIEGSRHTPPPRSQSAGEVSDSQKIRDLEDTLQKYKDENQFLRDELSKLRAKIGYEDDHIKRIRELEQRLRQCKEDHDKEVARLSEGVSAAGKDAPAEGCEEHEQLIKELQLNLSNYRMLNESLEKRNAELEAENERLNTILERFSDETFGALAEFEDENDQKMHDLVQHLHRLQKKNATLKSKTVQLELDNGRLKNDLEKLIGSEHKAFEKEMQRLHDLEQQMALYQEKNQKLRKRLMKLEIENKNVKQEYINTLIDKEKFILRSQEQNKRLRETGKLLRKTQDKKHDLAAKVIRLEVDNANLQQQLETAIATQLTEHIQKAEVAEEEELRQAIAELQAENERFREMLGSRNEIEDRPVRSTLEMGLGRRSSDVSRVRLVQLELENENLKRELETIKSKDNVSLGSQIVEERIADNILKQDEDQNPKMRIIELEIENEYLKSELEAKEKICIQNLQADKRIGELEEENRTLTEANHDLKRHKVELELDIEYMSRELASLQDALQKRHSETNLDLGTEGLRLKNEDLEFENKNLKLKLENISKEKISLEAHTLQKLVREIQRLMREFQDIKDAAARQPSARGRESLKSIEDVEHRLRLWKEKYEDQLTDMKRDVDRLSGKDVPKIKLESKLRNCQEEVQQLEQENKNMKIALQILLKEKGVMANVKLVREVEMQLARYKDTEHLKKLTKEEEKTIAELKHQLSECRELNNLLRNEKISLERHVQDQRIRELEAQVRFARSPDRAPNLEELDLTKIKDLEEQLQFLQESKEALKTELENLRIEKNLMQQGLMNQLQTCQARKAELKSEVERFSKLNSLQTQRSEELEEKLKRLEEELEVSKTMRFEDLAETETEGLDYDTLKERYKELRKICEEYKKRLADLEEQLRKCQDLNKFMKKKLNTVQHSEAATSGKENESVHLGDKEGSKATVTNGNEETQTDEETKMSELEQQAQQSQTDEKELTNELEKLRKVEEQLKESQKRVENFEKEIKNLQEENSSLKNDAQRVKELEERLRQTHTNYRLAKLELDKLQKDNLPISNKRLEKKVTDLEKQLQQSLINNQIDEAEIASKELMEEENEYLKQQVSRLLKKMESAEDENKDLKDQINTLTQMKDKLLREKDDQKEEIGKLQNKVQLLGGGEESVLEQLKKRNSENQELKLIISQLQTEIDDSKSRLEHGDVKEKARKLEETLWKYHDNNEFLKRKIKELEEEKKKQLEKEDKHCRECEVNEREVKRLESLLEKYRNTSESLTTNIASFRSSHRKRLERLERRVRNCQADSENLKKITKELEAEIESLKKDLAEKKKITSIEGIEGKDLQRCESIKIKTVLSPLLCQKPHAKSTSETSFEKLEIDLRQQKQKWKNAVAKLTEQYEENINLLKKQTQAAVMPTLQQPWIMQPPLVQAMPIVWQAPMITYGSFPLPQPIEQKIEVSYDNVRKMSSLVDKMQKTWDKNKAIEETEGTEKEERTYDFETCATSLKSRDGNPAEENIGVSLSQLNRQLIKHEETKAKIDKLQTGIQQTLKDLKEIAVKQKILVLETAVSDKKSETPGPSSVHKPQGEKPEFKCVFSKLPPAKAPSSTQKTVKKRPSPPSGERSVRKDEGKSFTPKKK